MTRIYILVSLVYTDGAVPYSHIQLRNTVEYSDFANIETLRNKSNPHAKSRKDEYSCEYIVCKF